MDTKNIAPNLDDFERRAAKYAPVAAGLDTLYPRKSWKHDPDWTGMDELVSCILSQSTTDANRDRGFAALKARYASWEEVHHAETDALIDTIRPAGLANSKGPRIQAVLERIREEHGAYDIDFLATMPLEEAKAWLTSLPGVGPKTAAIVLCFGYNRPAFPVDTHVLRVGKRLGFLPDKANADKAHAIMEAIVPPEDYYHFHLQMIYHGRALCKARTPQCGQCPLADHCDYFQATQKAAVSEDHE